MPHTGVHALQHRTEACVTFGLAQSEDALHVAFGVTRFAENRIADDKAHRN